MKNLSIRMKILSMVVIINLLGAVVAAVYLHESYSGDLDVSAARSSQLSGTIFEELRKSASDEFGSIKEPKGAQEYVDAMKSITADDYGIMLEKTALDQAAYVKAREDAGLPNNWDEMDEYVMVGITDEALLQDMKFKVPAADVPEAGKIVGVKNGACAQTCHGGMEARGDYWVVAWSKTAKSEAHAVYPIVEAGTPIGVVYSIANISAQADSARDSMMATLSVIGATLLVIVLIMGMLLDLLIFHRLKRMMASMEDISLRVAGGDFDAQYVASGSGDEIGRFETFFAKLMSLVSSTLKSLSK